MAPGLRTLLSATLAALAAADGLVPLPRNVTINGARCVKVSPSVPFVASGPGNASDILAQGITRYRALVFIAVPAVAPAACTATVGTVSSIVVSVANASEELALTTDESYTITAPASSGGAVTVTLSAQTVYGALRALETLSQLVDYQAAGVFTLPQAAVDDAPRFQHRGILLDTARHFIGVQTLLQFIDAMAYSRFNVLHWHIVDSQSFPWVSATYPQLSAQGAWGAPDPVAVASHTYGAADVQNVITYARYRGVRVVPEFDTPGHSTCWGNGQPGLLVQCYNTTTNQPIPGSFGPLDPTKESTYTFMKGLWAEVAHTWPDAVVHVGGDEVDFTCWASNPDINAWMAANGINAGNYSALESIYVQRNIDIVDSIGKQTVAWQEVFDNHLQLPPGTIVNVWRFHSTTATRPGTAAAAVAAADGAGPTWQEELFNVTQAGFSALVSSPWYLNYIAYGDDWTPYLTTDISSFGGSAAQQALVVGGEVSIWSEFIDTAQLLSRTFPRASAAAESLWLNPGAGANVTDAQNRMNAHRCRMLNRGIPAEVAVGPSWCPQELVPPYTPPWATAQ